MQHPENGVELPARLDAESQYQWLCAHADLASLRLVGVQAALQPVDVVGALSYDIAVEVDGTHIPGDGLVFQATHTLEVVDEDSQGVFSAALSYVVGYNSAIAELSDELVAAFGHRSVLLTLAPYVRAEVQRLTTEAGLPPLLLGLFKVPQQPAAENQSGWE